MNIDAVEKKMRKTHMLFRRNKAATMKAKNLASFAKTLEPDALALMVLNLIANLAPTMTKAKLAKRLRESCEIDEIWTDHFEPIVTDLYEDLPQRNLKLSDLLEEVREATS